MMVNNGFGSCWSMVVVWPRMFRDTIVQQSQSLLLLILNTPAGKYYEILNENHNSKRHRFPTKSGLCLDAVFVAGLFVTWRAESCQLMIDSTAEISSYTPTFRRSKAPATAAIAWNPMFL